MATGSLTAGLAATHASVVGTGSGTGAALCAINLQVNERALRFSALVCGDSGASEEIRGIALMPPEEGYRLLGGLGDLASVEIENNTTLRLTTVQAGNWMGWLKIEFADAYSA